ncbi:MAG: peptidase S8, partial [SAR202 cluster bacterium]|nr:peptidase S8 [SAR202 cluster bacterium]
LMNVKVLRDDGFGWWSWVAKGITWSADHGARVINMSLGGDVPSSTLEQAINYAWSKGVILVAAAGNQNVDGVLYPAAYSNVIAVAATDRQDNKSDFSNYGAGVDIAAPGGGLGANYAWLDPNVGVLSTMPNRSNYFYRTYGVPLNYGSLAGTSMATPHVAGVAALLVAECPGWSNLQVRQRLETTSDPLGDPLLGGLRGIGRLNALRAISGGC